MTGQHGAQRHLGNLVIPSENVDIERLDIDAGANLTELSRKFDTSAYLTPHSDIVALLVLEHQAQMHNLITRANFLTRLALNDNRVINEMLGLPPDRRSESTERRIRSAGERLVEYMLFRLEAKLTDPVAGTSRFAEDFAALGPRDRQGRSLRDLDLKVRLFKHPLSYLIYSESFDELPGPMKDYVYRRLWEVLGGEDTSGRFRHLSAADRRAIVEILVDTKPDLPAYWSSRESKRTAL